MEQLLKELFELAKKDRNIIQGLKKIAIDSHNFGMAAELREFEKKQFPKILNTDKEYKEAEQFAGCCGMTQLKVTSKVGYIFLNIAKAFLEKGDLYDLKSASKIIANANSIFGDEN